MATRIQFRRGTSSQHASFTGAVGEMTVDTDKDVVVVHDGSTAGGFEMLRSDLSNLDISGTDAAGKVILSDGDGTFTYGSGAKVRQVVQATNSTRTGLSATTARTVYWNAFSFTKQVVNSTLHIQCQLPLGGGGDTYPGFGIDFIRFSTSNYSTNGSDIFGYLNNTRATSNNMGAFVIGNFLYDTTGTNISGATTVYVSIGYDSASSGTWRPAPIWNPNASEDARGRQSISSLVITEIE